MSRLIDNFLRLEKLAEELREQAYQILASDCKLDEAVEASNVKICLNQFLKQSKYVRLPELKKLENQKDG